MAFVYGQFGSDDVPHCYDTTTSLGANLREFRRKLNLSQPIAADMVGITRGVLSKIEAGHSKPSLGTLAAFALAYEVPLSEIFDGVPAEELL